MGEGINLATVDNPQLRKLMDDMKDQLLIVLMNRLGGKSGVVRVPVAEVDGSGAFLLSMRLDAEHKAFVFKVEKKQ